MMNDVFESLQCLVGLCIDGHEISSVEKDPFVRNQINIITTSEKYDAFGDAMTISFRINKRKGKEGIYK